MSPTFDKPGRPLANPDVSWYVFNIPSHKGEGAGGVGTGLIYSAIFLPLTM